jgi:hypothetical protein
MLAVCTPSIALTLIVPPVSVVRSSDFSVTACALPVLVTVLVTVWMPLVNVTAWKKGIYRAPVAKTMIVDYQDLQITAPPIPFPQPHR